MFEITFRTLDLSVGLYNQIFLKFAMEMNKLRIKFKKEDEKKKKKKKPQLPKNTGIITLRGRTTEKTKLNRTNLILKQQNRKWKGRRMSQ